MDNGRAPTIVEFNALFNWKHVVPDALASVSLPTPSVVDIPSPISINTQVFAADEIQVMDPLINVIHSATKSVVQSAYKLQEQAVKYATFYI